MGSWNKTCALTGLHIEGDVPVHGFVIIETPYSNRCDATSLWAPVLLPFTGTYDGYGNTENTSNELIQILDLLRPNIVRKKAGNNPYHERKVCPKTIGIQGFFNAVADDRLRVRMGFSKPSRVEFVLVRTDCMMHLLNNWDRTLFIGYDDTTNRQYFHYTYKDLVPQIPVFLQRLTDEMSASPDRSPYLLIHGLVSDIRDTKTETPSLRALCEYLGALFNEFNINRNIRAIQVFTHSLQNGKGHETLSGLLTGIFVHSFMCMSRKIWVPTCHEGSQAEPLAEYKLLANTVLHFVNKYEQMYQDTHEDDEPEEPCLTM